MTAIVCDLTDPDRALIASDSLQYAVHRSFTPVAMGPKIYPVPPGGVLWGKGVPEVAMRAALALLERGGELRTAEDAIKALPAILRREMAAFARRHGIDNAAALMLAEVSWCGWSERLNKFEVVVFRNYENNFVPRRDFAGNVTFFVSPETPPAYVPANWNRLDTDARIIAAFRSIQRFICDHGRTLSMPPVGGQILLVEATRDGFVDYGAIAHFDDYEEAEAAIEAHIEALQPGFDLVNKVADAPAAYAKMQQIMAGSTPVPTIAPVSAPMNRQARRAAEKAARKAGRAA